MNRIFLVANFCNNPLANGQGKFNSLHRSDAEIKASPCLLRDCFNFHFQMKGISSAYGALLTDHIFKENEVLYPWMERNMSDPQIGRLYSSFLSVEETFNSIGATGWIDN